ncbi:MAG: hypothetical protein GYA36_09995 [Veillonellaceae bacterium]|nr:hypothetical protein [Veillonellaceae bacterium]
MKYEELLAKYQALLLENANFKRQIELLKAASIPADSTGQEADGGFASYLRETCRDFDIPMAWSDRVPAKVDMLRTFPLVQH